jgi:hypothetical protein
MSQDDLPVIVVLARRATVVSRVHPGQCTDRAHDELAVMVETVIPRWGVPDFGAPVVAGSRPVVFAALSAPACLAYDAMLSPLPFGVVKVPIEYRGKGYL